MKILVTGSQGTLGVPLVKELRKRGHEVWGCDLKHSDDPQYTRADVSEMRQIDKVFFEFRPDLVYHLAAEFGRVNGEEYYEQLWKTNQVGTQHVIKLCLLTGAKLVLAGSSEAYGESNLDLLHESWLDKRIPVYHNQYALSKWMQEQQVFVAAKNDGLKAVVLRFFNAYGPGEYYNDFRSVVCLFCYRLMKNMPITVYENYHRVFMYVDDWANTVANVAERFDSLPKGDRPSGVPVYNVGGSEYRSIEELVTVISDQLGGTFSRVTVLPKEKANVTNKRPDISAAIKDLGHNTSTKLEQGVALTLEWMKKIYA
jgi:dTDP-glucose 4,6-dehydratase